MIVYYSELHILFIMNNLHFDIVSAHVCHFVWNAIRSDHLMWRNTMVYVVFVADAIVSISTNNKWETISRQQPHPQVAKEAKTCPCWPPVITCKIRWVSNISNDTQVMDLTD